MNAPEGYRLERGMLWPASDRGAAGVLFGSASDLQQVYPHIKRFDVAVQAGGNCGIWPKALGNRFGLVYTFEPDPVNFRCLCANAPAENVFKFNAALGAAHRGVSLVLRPDNVGSHHVGDAGPIPMLTIDDLSLTACDLICLDVEGYEMDVLKGAMQTINRFRPTIVIEDVSGLEHVAGVGKGQTAAWLEGGFKYRVAAKAGKDVVLVP